MADRDKIIIAISLAYLLEVLFDLVPGGGPNATKYSFFPLYHGEQGWDGRMSLHNYVYGYCGHIFIILIFYAIYRHTGRPYWQWLMWLEIVAVLDYAIIYNSTWFNIGLFEVEYNTVRFPLVLYFTNNEYGSSGSA